MGDRELQNYQMRERFEHLVDGLIIEEFVGKIPSIRTTLT
jgi:hypothetical protein